MTDGVERRIQLTHGNVYDGLRAMQERRDVLWAEYETLAQDCITVEKAVEVLQRRAVDDRLENPPATEVPVPPSVISFDGCGNSGDRLVRMAEGWGGVVSCNDGADLLIRMGLSKAGRANLVQALQKEMAANEDLWEYASPRTYRYRLYRNPLESTAHDAIEDGLE